MFLPYLNASPSQDFTSPSKTLTFATTFMNPGKISNKFNIEEYDNSSSKTPELIELTKIMSFHQRLRTAIIWKIVQDTNTCQENNLKHYDTAIISTSNPYKKKCKNLDQTLTIKEKTNGHRMCVDFRNTDKPP